MTERIPIAPRAPAWEGLPPDVREALLEEAERVWNGDGEELRFYRVDKHAKLRRIPRGETRTVATNR